MKVTHTSLPKYQGYWWLPDDPEEIVPGTLNFDPDEGARLDLLGSLKGARAEDIGTMIDPKLILGESAEGKLITLQDCGETESKRRVGSGFATSSLYAGIVFVGEHFQRPDDVGFERLFVEYLHLDAWAGVSGFEIKLPVDETHPLSVEYKSPERRTATVGDEFEVTLSFNADVRASTSPLVTETTITQRAVLAIEFPEKKPLEHLQGIAYRLQHFLSLGTRKSVYPVALWGKTGPKGEAKPVQVNYRSVARRGADDKTPTPRDMLFGLRDLPEGFGPTVEWWLERAEVLDPVYQLYLGTIYNPQSYLEQRFLNLVQALEVYHRRAMSSSDLQEEEHKKRKEEILEAVPDQHKRWLERKLKYSNEPTLAERLREIFGRYPESISLIIGKSKKAKANFIDKVVASRNYLTHFDQSLEAKAAQGEGLYPITQKLRLLIEICLLGEIGFEAERIRDLIK